MNKADELEFLRWFYCNADFGPADSDVRDILKNQFKRQTGKELPDGYQDEEEEFGEDEFGIYGDGSEHEFC